MLLVTDRQTNKHTLPRAMHMRWMCVTWQKPRLTANTRRRFGIPVILAPYTHSFTYL